MNLKKYYEKETLANITIILCILSLMLTILTYRLSLPSILNVLINGTIFTIIYLVLIMDKNCKSAKTLNIILFINYILAVIIGTISKIKYIKMFFENTYTIPYYNRVTFIFDSIFDIIPYILIAIMIYGILSKKQMPYKIFMYILVSIFAINQLENLYVLIFETGFSLYYMLHYLIIGLLNTIKVCAFVSFLNIYREDLIKNK